jgi:hypothetical protein
MVTEFFSPSHVEMGRALPLVGVFDHSEREAAVALLVLTCRAWGNQWSPVTLRQISLALAFVGPAYRWTRNPFFRPLFPEAIEHGLVREVLVDRANALELTAAAIQRLHGSGWNLSPDAKISASKETTA